MGLAVSTGMLADLLKDDTEGAEWLKESLSVVNRVLRTEGLPEHTEPDDVPMSIRRSRVSGFPCSFLHYLRLAYAYRMKDINWLARPLSQEVDPSNDAVLEEEASRMDSHLLCHSDCDGFYVPIKFADVLVDPKGELEGGMLGSTHTLMEELRLVAPALGISLENGDLTDQEASEINTRAESGAGIYRELMVWICLFEACRESIYHRTAICFT